MSTAIAVRPVLAHRLGRSRTVLALGAPLVFLSLHVAMLLHTLDASRTQELAEHTYLDPYAQTLIGVLGTDLLTFAAFAVAGAMLARRGYRVLWVLPTLIGVFGYAIGAPHIPQPIGSGWSIYESAPHWYSNAWLGSVIDVALCLAVALPFLSRPRRRSRGRPAAVDVLALLAVAVVVAITLRTTQIVNNYLPATVVLASVCVYGFLARTSRPWPWDLLLVALGIGGTLGMILRNFLPLPWSGEAPSVAEQVVSSLETAVPLLICAVTVSSWDRLGSALRGAARHPVWLLVAVNALNVADALLTQFAVRAGAAVELNPVVRLIGLPAKLVLVGALSWFLYRRRPATLLIPAAVLLVVLAYHVSGLIIDG